MNGRLYDPVLMTFLMPDNFVQAPDNTQSYNRYAYVWNNPLKYTDPSGEFFPLNFEIDLFKNIFKHGFKFSDYDWQRTEIRWKLDKGLFQGNLGQILSRFTWESIQTTAGYLVSNIQNIFGGVKSVNYYGGATISESYSMNWGAFTLGNYIFGQRGIQANPDNSLFQHEYGHYLQSESFGPIYLSKFAIPSFLDLTGFLNFQITRFRLLNRMQIQER